MSNPPAAGAPVAVVGLGQMGSGMASSLVRAGHTVLGVDPGPPSTPEGVDRTELAGALQQADVVVLSLPGGDQVEQVVEQVRAVHTPKLVIDTSTCDPTDTRRRAQLLADTGHVLADAPVSGGPSGALAGELTVFLGCAEEHLERVRRALEPLAGRVTHVGDVGAGHTAKLVNNLLCGIHLSASRTLLEVGERSGIDPARLLEAVNAASGRSGVTEVNLPRWVLSGTFDSGFPVGLMARDVDLAATVAQELGASSPVVRAAREMWAQLRDEVGPQEDFNRMVKR
ncbi:NAD(P)-dependent oxidoreductase [Ornithinimicrobium pratense]|uniref:NAD(P)-dependent oxidoreductase n=1 Tax=Ornithinimicrobium pratense TaxID=2593973 RepID=A0A5J6V5R2_9MICO|nr:NAD(P)-dependent oxidoreductase [Ornithinimicrobium pratense]QFG68491.1 NAD(P)-dependent oxidoreductase [Ornithinimicrobium pratense]